MLKALTIFSGNANRELAQAICRYVETPLGRAEVTRFADGEVYVEINENVRGVNCFVVQPTCAPANDNLMELLVMIDALKRASAGSIIAVIPYFGYARQDRKSKPRTPISARLVADLLTAAGVNRVLSIDLHAGQIQGFFNIPVDHLYAMPVLMDDLRLRFTQEAVIVSPDAGGVERARAYSKRLGTSLAIIDKRRPAPNVCEVVNIIGDVKGRDAIIVDDMVDTAGTLCAAAQAVKAQGARAVFACASHGVLSPPAIERIMASPLEELLITDTVPVRAEVRDCPKIKVLPVARLLGEAVKRIHHGDSISSLLSETRETHTKGKAVMDFAKVNVEVRSGTGKGGSRKVRAAGKVPGVVYGRKVEPVTVTFDEKELLTSLDKEKRRNTVLKLSISGRRQVRGGDGDGARGADQSAVAAAGPRRLPARRSRRRGARDCAAGPDRQGDRHHRRRQPAPEPARHPDRGQAGRHPDQAGGRRHPARDRRRAPRQRPQAGRRGARAARSARRHRVGRGAEGREGRGRGGARRGRGAGGGRGWRGSGGGWCGSRGRQAAAGKEAGGKEEKKGKK